MSNYKGDELEERLIDFTVTVLNLTDNLEEAFSGLHFKKQLIRSGSSTALIYGEARGAESQKDFIHKMGIGLMELRESFITMKIIKRKPFVKKFDLLDRLLVESNELISIFVSSIKTAKANL